jgi:hypothetical protein
MENCFSVYPPRVHVALTHASMSQRVYRGDIDTPKTDKSKRKAGLPEGLRQDLTEWLAAELIRVRTVGYSLLKI